MLFQPEHVRTFQMKMQFTPLTVVMAVLLARALRSALVAEPDVLILDEPTSALDVSVQAAVTDLLMEIQRENKTTLLVTHQLQYLRHVDRIIVLQEVCIEMVVNRGTILTLPSGRFCIVSAKLIREHMSPYPG